jgi:hypothetical protein
VLDLWIGFFANRGHGNFNTGFARTFQHKERKAAVTRDQT